MRITRASTAITLLLAAGFVAGWGCVDHLDDCLWNGECLVGTRGAGGGGGGGGGTIDPGCVPSENAKPIASICGVYVSSSLGDDGAAGTQSAPVRTLGQALALAKQQGKPVYACAETFAEALKVDAGSVIYGGLSCASGWLYVGASTKTAIEPAADPAAVNQIAMVFSGAGKTHIEDVSVKAPDATLAGGSSIGALADGGSVELVRSELTAGNGMKGAKGETPSDPVGPSDPNDAAIRGVNGVAACMGNASGTQGGAGMVNSLCTTAIGGDGGAGHVMLGDKGADGQPLPSPNPNSKGLGGAGDDGSGSGCNAGFGGQIGAIGASGVGAAASSYGTLTSAGFVGASGGAGAQGGPGQGGGGGGGAKGKSPGAPCTTGNGASGGGGGAGGCGGNGGLGGMGGGASIALASVNASVALTDVRLSSGTGGDGGEGGDGQDGGTGGVGGLGGVGNGTLPACDGGKGGVGGFGGKGGGGRGGHSVGIAFLGTQPTATNVTYNLGTAGQGGPGADAAGQGAPGTQQNLLELK